MANAPLPKELLRLLKPQLPQMLDTLHRLVEAESPSLEKAAADRCCGVIAGEWCKHGARVERIVQKHRCDILRISRAPGKSRASGQLLVLGHYDTVYSSGTLEKMPFRVSAGKAYGPGTFDMKAGIVQALFALPALRQMEIPLRKRLVFLWTSDEEIASEASRKLLEAEARRSAININAGLIEGGTRTNVIPEHARVVLDLRALHSSDMRSLEDRLRDLRPVQSGARLEITGGFDRPPLERKMSATLFARAQLLAKEMNLSLGECTVGGGSDGNFTAALGIPTLDGLVAVADGPHSSPD